MASPDSSDGGDRGIVYVATVNDRFVAEAFLSAETVKQRHPELPITLFTDRPRHPLCKLGCFDSVEPIERVQSFGSSWAAGQLARLRCLPRTPHARTLHLDTDTRVLTEELPWLFDRLGEADVAMVETAEDDSYSRLYSGLRMFNAGLILYRRTEQVWKWLDTWARLTERNFRLADQSPLPALPLLRHVGAEDMRRRLLYMDQISLVEILGPERNSFDLSVLNLDYSWNHRGSQKPENNRNAVRILHTPVLKTLTHADLLAVASTWKRAGRAATPLRCKRMRRPVRRICPLNPDRAPASTRKQPWTPSSNRQPPRRRTIRPWRCMARTGWTRPRRCTSRCWRCSQTMGTRCVISGCCGCNRTASPTVSRCCGRRSR